MADSFNGVALTIVNQGVPRKMAADISVRHIPAGNTSYVDIGGQQLRTIDLALFFRLGSDAIAFEAQLGLVGTLDYFDGVFQVVLSSISRSSRALSALGQTILTAEFYLL